MGDARPKGPTRLECYRVIVELVKALVWPAIFVSLLVAFWSPLSYTVDVLLNKLWEAKKVGIGALSIEIQEQARARGNPKLARRLNGLSPEAIRLLLEIGRAHHLLVSKFEPRPGEKRFSLVPADEFDRIRELAEKGLVEYGEDLDNFLEWIQSDLFLQESGGLSKHYTFWPKRDLSSAESARLNEQHYRLTDLGQSAWEAVLAAIIEQLRVSPLDRERKAAQQDTAAGY